MAAILLGLNVLIGNHKTARPSTSEATLKNVGKLD